ncbi:MAG: hypothetical protein VW258_07495 [Thalassolituus sp.]
MSAKLLCVTSLVFNTASADPIYAEDFDAALPPVPDTVDGTSVIGTWLLTFTDLATYEATDTDGNKSVALVKAVGRVYSLVQPKATYDVESQEYIYDYSRPQPLRLSCLPFDDEDGTSDTPDTWENSYESHNSYYNPSTGVEKPTGTLSVTFHGDGTVQGEGSYTQHPAGFSGRFLRDNLISHTLTFSGIKISDTPSIADNDDFDTTINAPCFGAIQLKKKRQNITATSTEILPSYWLESNKQILTPPYFDNYDFYAEVFSAKEGRTYIHRLTLK